MFRNSFGYLNSYLYPRMPDPESPQYDAWKAQIASQLTTLDGEVVLIGHSLGGSVLLKYLSEERCEKSIAGLFLVAAPFWSADDWQADEFLLRSDFAGRLPHALRVFIYQSPDDEIVPFGHLSLYAERLPLATVRAVNGVGHEFTRCFLNSSRTSKP